MNGNSPFLLDRFLHVCEQILILINPSGRIPLVYTNAPSNIYPPKRNKCREKYNLAAAVKVGHAPFVAELVRFDDFKKVNDN